MKLATRFAGQALAVAVTATSVTLPVALTTATPAYASTCPAPGGTAIAEAPTPDAEVAFLGHGYGHSIGMSQYGAQGAAKLGCTHREILGTYYAGTTLAQRTTPAEMKIWMLVNGTHADVLAENGSVTWKLSGSTATLPVQPLGATWKVRPNSAKTAFELVDVATGAVKWSGGASGGTLVAGHEGTVVAVKSYRGTTQYLARRLRWDETRYKFDSYGMDAVQAMTAGYVPEMGKTISAMDKYLWGLAEVPLSWTRYSHEALRTQAVAARTYAYAKHEDGVTTLYPTMTHQFYNGYDKEYEDITYKDQYGRNLRWADAVLSTSGNIVVTATGATVDTFFTSSHGGFSEDERYVWGGTTDIPYLRAFDDSTWDAKSDGNYYRSWARGFTKAHIATKFGFDSVTSVTVADQGTLERHKGMTITGVDGGVATTRTYAGDRVRRTLGLPSPGFTVVMPVATVAVTAPGAPTNVSATSGYFGGPSNATVRWAAPVSDGGSAITAYQVRAVRYSGGVYVSTTLSSYLSPSSRYYVMTLPKGYYKFQVRAVNSVGVGTWSAATAQVTAR